MEPDLSIIIPTYNEESTVAQIVYEINGLLKHTDITFEILVVDDNSPDKTGFIINEMSAFFPVRLITRTTDPGLSQSVIEGFGKARGKVIIVTDSDGSHDILIIPQMYQEIKNGTDIVVGSRYCVGGGIKDWPIKRRVISWGATFLSKILFPCCSDPISGFFGVKKELVFHAPLKSCGYKILLEILGKSYWHTISEIPYVFQNRKAGISKLRPKTIFEFVRQLYSVALFPGRARKEVTKIKKFAVVGISGIFINMIILAMLKEWFSVPLVGASFIAIELSIISNFVLNDNYTFRGEKNDKSWLHRLFSFNAVSVGGMLINVVVLALLSTVGVWYIIGNFVGILVGFGWNFIGNRRLTWGKN